MNYNNFESNMNHYPPDKHCRRPCVPIGIIGPPGPPGPTGPTGPTGPPGTPGTPGIGAIIPFASGSNFALGTNTGNLARNVAIIAFGAGTLENTTVNSAISVVNDLQAFAFVTPRAGTITSIAASAVGQAVTGTAPTITAQLYSAAINGTEFTPIPGALVTFNAPATNAANGAVANINIPVLAQQRILMVVYASDSTNTGVVNVFINAGIAIS